MGIATPRKTSCDWFPRLFESSIIEHPAEYVYGMAPRTDATDRGLANRNVSEQYIIMRAHARALEIELLDVKHNVSDERKSEAGISSPRTHGSAFLSERMAEDYIRTLPWTPSATEDEKALVAGNIRTFARWLRNQKCRCGALLAHACSQWTREAIAHQQSHTKHRRNNRT
jgi:hypothetical protein